jgi:hypothetical protein
MDRKQNVRGSIKRGKSVGFGTMLKMINPPVTSHFVSSSVSASSREAITSTVSERLRSLQINTVAVLATHSSLNENWRLLITAFEFHGRTLNVKGVFLWNQEDFNNRDSTVVLRDDEYVISTYGMTVQVESILNIEYILPSAVWHPPHLMAMRFFDHFSNTIHDLDLPAMVYKRELPHVALATMFAWVRPVATFERGMVRPLVCPNCFGICTFP